MAEVFIIASATFLVDQWTKRIVRLYLGDRTIYLGPILQLRYASHRRPAYTHAAARIFLIVWWIVALAAAVTLHLSGSWLQRDAALWGLGLAFGGAGANLFDILRLHYIENFIELRACSIFNLADTAIVAGLCVAIVAQ